MTQAVAWYTVARRIRPLACGRRYHRVAPVSASNLDSFRATIIPGAEPLLSRGSVMIVNVNERTGMKESADASNALFVKDGFEASGPRPDDHLPGVSAGRFAGCSAVMGITAMAQSRGWQVDAITAQSYARISSAVGDPSQTDRLRSLGRAGRGCGKPNNADGRNHCDGHRGSHRSS